MVDLRHNAKHRALALAALWLLSGLYLVRPEQQAVVRLLGRVVAEGVQPGLHWRVPWPLTRLSKVRISEARRLSVGFDLADEAAGRQPAPGKSHFLTGDQNIVNLQLVAQYCVERPTAFLFRSKEVGKLVGAVVERELSHAVEGQGVDWVLTTGRAQLQETVRREAQRVLDGYGAGVRLVSTNIKAAYPPTEVNDAFKAVAGARSDRDRIIDLAEGYRNEVTEQAAGEADKMTAEADAYRQRVTTEARGDTARFASIYREYSQARQVTRDRMYVETMEELLPRMKVIVADPAGGTRPLDLAILSGDPKPNTAGGSR